MPQGFDMCRAKGGKIRTILLSRDRYMHVCYLGDKSFPGEVKNKKKQIKK